MIEIKKITKVKRKKSTHFLSGKSKLLISLLFIIYFSFLLRIYNISHLPTPFHIDEIFMLQEAISIIKHTQSLFHSQFSTTVISNLFTSIFIKLFNINPLTVRLQSIIFGLLGSIFTFLFVRKISNTRSAYIALILISTSHLNIAYSRLNLPNIQVIFFITSALYFTIKTLQDNSKLYSLVTGMIVGLSLYSYSGAKIIPLILIGFILVHWKNFNKRKSLLVYIFIGFLISTLPLFSYTIKQNYFTHDYLQRENEVFIINKPKYWKLRWKTNSLAKVLINQLKVNFLSFSTLPDHSNQYGIIPLLDPISAGLFYISLIIFTPLSLYNIFIKRIKKNEEAWNILFLICSFITILFLASLTESPPLSTRLLISQPFIFSLIAILLEKISDTNTYIKKLTLIIILLIVILNLKLYFIKYYNNGPAAYSWIEPNYSIAKYIHQSKNNSTYVLSNPHTYATQATITVLNFNNKKIIRDISKNQVSNLIKDNCKNINIIIPLYPKQTYLPNYINLISCPRRIYFGRRCPNCPRIPLFLIFSDKP